MSHLLLLALFLQASYGAERLALIEGYAFVKVAVNGHAFRMLLDTGASSCALTPEAARRAGLAYDHRVVVETPAGNVVVPAATAHVELGTHNLDAEILAQPLDGVRNVDSAADGVLGQSFLGRFPVLIDYKNKRLLIGAEAEQQSGTLSSPVSAERVQGRMVVPVTLGDGKTWRLALDSGSERLLLECGRGCPRLAGYPGDTTILTNAGERQAQTGVVKGVRIGPIALSRAETLVITRTPAADREDGLLPAHLFSVVYVDPARNQVRFGK